MYAPVLLPEAPPVSKAVREMEAQIEREEGHYHVAGVFYANENDGARQRRWYAECRVRREALQKMFCAWCHERFEPTDERVPAGAREIHKQHCAADYAAFTTPAPFVSCPQCGDPLTERDAVVAIGLRNVHESCAESFETATFGGAGAAYEAAALAVA